MGRSRVALVLPWVALVIAGCATTVPPERQERDRALLAAIEPCRQRYPELFGRLGVHVKQDGVIHYWYKSHLVGQTYELDLCFREAQHGLKIGPFAAGRLAASAAPASVAVGVSGKAVVVPARINGIAALLLVSQASGLTYVRPGYAKRAGLEVVAESPTASVRFDNQTVAVPFVRARSVEVGAASVEALDIGIYERATLTEKVDGVLGGNFLSHFRMHVDHPSKRLTLEPAR